MKSIGFFSRFSAIAIVIIQSHLLLYSTLKWFDKTTIDCIADVLTDFFILLVFITILIKADEKSRAGRCSFFALVSVILSFIGSLIFLILLIDNPGSWIDFLLGKTNPILILMVVAKLVGFIVLPIAVLSFSISFPVNSLSFWGGIVFSSHSFLRILLPFFFTSSELKKISHSEPIISLISIIGLSLFFFGLTLKVKKSDNTSYKPLEVSMKYISKKQKQKSSTNTNAHPVC